MSPVSCTMNVFESLPVVVLSYQMHVFMALRLNVFMERHWFYLSSLWASAVWSVSQIHPMANPCRTERVNQIRNGPQASGAGATECRRSHGDKISCFNWNLLSGDGQRLNFPLRRWEIDAVGSVCHTSARVRGESVHNWFVKSGAGRDIVMTGHFYP